MKKISFYNKFEIKIKGSPVRSKMKNNEKKIQLASSFTIFS